jgi:hypothetical protein
MMGLAPFANRVQNNIGIDQPSDDDSKDKELKHRLDYSPPKA